MLLCGVGVKWSPFSNVVVVMVAAVAGGPGAHSVPAGVPGVSDDQVSATARPGHLQPSHEPCRPRGPRPAERICALNRGRTMGNINRRDCLVKLEVLNQLKELER